MPATSDAFSSASRLARYMQVTQHTHLREVDGQQGPPDHEQRGLVQRRHHHHAHVDHVGGGEAGHEEPGELGVVRVSRPPPQEREEDVEHACGVVVVVVVVEVVELLLLFVAGGQVLRSGGLGLYLWCSRAPPRTASTTRRC